VTISFRIVKNSEPISLAEGSFAFMRLVLQQPAKALLQNRPLQASAKKILVIKISHSTLHCGRQWLRFL